MVWPMEVVPMGNWGVAPPVSFRPHLLGFLLKSVVLLV